MTIGLFGTNTFRGIDSLTTTIPYYVVKVLIAIPRGRQVSNVEKLLLPFKYIIWCTIATCFATGLLVILILKRSRPEVRFFVLGRNNSDPILYMVSVWLGSVVTRLPGRNFARFLLVMWILLAFVLRSAYQGALFDILRLKKSIAPVNTIEKMAEANYKIFVSTRLAKYVRQMDKKIQSQVRVIPTTEVDNHLMLTLKTNFYGAVVVVEPTILHFNRFKVPEGQKLIHSSIIVHNIQNTIYVDKRSCLLEPFNQELWKYLSSGLISSWTSQFLKTAKDPGMEEEFKAMTIRDVMGIFQVYAVLSLVACFVFIVEFWWGKTRRRRERAKKKKLKIRDI